MPMEVRDSLRKPLGFSEDQVSECLEYVLSLPPKDFRRILEFAEKQADEMAGQMPEFTDPSRDDGGSFQRASEEKLRTRRVVKVADRFRSAEAEAGARAKAKAMAAEAEAKAAKGFPKWIASQMQRLSPKKTKVPVWQVLTPLKADSDGGENFEIMKDGSLLAKFFFVQDPDGYEIEVLQRHGRFK